MAMTFDTDPGRRRCNIGLTGVISLSDMKASVRRQIDADVWTWETLINTTGATGIESTSADITRLTNVIDGEMEARQLPPRGPMVLVVANPHSTMHELARQYQVMAMNSSGLRIEIVRSLLDADAAFARLAVGERRAVRDRAEVGRPERRW